MTSTTTTPRTRAVPAPKLPVLVVTFSLTFTLFLIFPAFLSGEFPPYALLKYGDVFDLLTPLVLIPLYWALYARVARAALTPTVIIVFMVFSALWVLGQGMHLAANSIGHQLEALKDTPAYTLTYFYDEQLSHYLWHLGIFGLTTLIMVRSWKAQAEKPANRTLLLLTVILYGSSFASITLEGQTWPVGLPFAILAGVIPLLGRRSEFWNRPVLSFFTLAHLLAVVMMIVWTVIQGGFIEPSDVMNF